MTEGLEKRLEDHMDSDNRNFERLTAVLEKFVAIEARLVAVETTIAELKTDIGWIKKAFWILMTPLASGLVLAVLAIILK